MSGPVQVLVVGFEQPSVSGAVIAELDRLREAGVVRLIDVLLVHRLEDGSTSLDEALALWERGEALHALCRAKLDQAETRVAELLERMGRTPPAAG